MDMAFKTPKFSFGNPDGPRQQDPAPNRVTGVNAIGLDPLWNITGSISCIMWGITLVGYTTVSRRHQKFGALAST